MANYNDGRIGFLYGIHGTREEVGFKSLVAQGNFTYQTPKPIKQKCCINEQFFGEEWVPTPDLWTPLCGCDKCNE